MKIALIIPVYNEEKCLGSTIQELVHWSERHSPQHDITIIIANNGSTDGTQRIASQATSMYENVELSESPLRGKGGAIVHAWNTHTADAYLFTDADLAYGTETIDQIIEVLAEGAPVAIASRMVRGASHHQTPLRRIVTQGYNSILHLFFKHTFSDAQAGCKGVSREAKEALLPSIYERGMFFDTQLLLEAERQGFSIQEIPTTNIDPRPRPPNPFIVLYLFYKIIELRLKRRKK